MNIPDSAGSPRRLRRGCPAAITLTPEDHRFLDAQPYGTFEAGWHYGCGLEPGHAELHFAFVDQADGELEYWIRWSAEEFGRYTLVRLPGCPYREEDGGDLCTLPAEHAGKHNIRREWQPQEPDSSGPSPAPGRHSVDYLEHRRAALTHAEVSSDPGQLHATLALAAAVSRVADLLTPGKGAQ